MINISLVLVAVYGLLLLLTLLFKGPVLKGPWLFLLRAFFPNWQFFHALGRVPHLYVRAATALSTNTGFATASLTPLPTTSSSASAPTTAPPNAALTWTDWQWVYPRRARRGLDLFFNAETNLLLAQQNLVDHFWADLIDLPEGADARQLVSFALIDQLALNCTLAHWPQARQRQFELRLVAAVPPESQTMLTTPVLPC